MAYVEADRVSIREYLGYSAIFLQADPRLENAITSSQSTVDGGTRPTSDTETLAKALVTSLKAVDVSIDNLDALSGATIADGDQHLDAARELARLRSKGRHLVHRLARVFDTLPRADIFSAAPADADAMGPPYGRSPY